MNEKLTPEERAWEAAVKQLVPADQRQSLSASQERTIKRSLAYQGALLDARRHDFGEALQRTPLVRWMVRMLEWAERKLSR